MLEIPFENISNTFQKHFKIYQYLSLSLTTVLKSLLLQWSQLKLGDLCCVYNFKKSGDQEITAEIR